MKSILLVLLAIFVSARAQATPNMNNLFYCDDSTTGAYHEALSVEALGGYQGAYPTIGSQGELDWIDFCEAACVQEAFNQNIPSGTEVCCKSYTYSAGQRTCVLVTEPGTTKTYPYAAGWGGSFTIPAEELGDTPNLAKVTLEDCTVVVPVPPPV